MFKVIIHLLNSPFYSKNLKQIFEFSESVLYTTLHIWLKTPLQSNNYLIQSGEANHHWIVTAYNPNIYP